MCFLGYAGYGTGSLQQTAFGLHRWMGVHLQRGFDVCMAQNFRKGFCIHSPFNAACGKGMAKHMIIPGRNIQGNLEPLETVLQRSGFHWFTAAGQDIVFWFRAQRTKQRKHFCRQGHPEGSIHFWASEEPVPCVLRN